MKTVPLPVSVTFDLVADCPNLNPFLIARQTANVAEQCYSSVASPEQAKTVGTVPEASARM